MSHVELFGLEAERSSIAVLWYRARRERGITLIAGHGYSSSKHNLDFLCSFLAGHGYGVYSFDFPGHKLGASGGELRSVDDCVDAMRRVVAFSRERGDESAYTIGHSMGAMTALFTAALDPALLGSIAIATGYGKPTAVEALAAVGPADFRSSYVVGAALPDLVADVERVYDELLPRLAGRPVLYVAASRDAMVSPRSVRALYERAPGPKWFSTIESDHTYAAEHAKATVLEWLNERHPARAAARPRAQTVCE
ncbi:MAG: alpha/beta fold hydrolase [Candidatus Eremiobacteraeota bacterium]|nr:alpha/beta fold hydrolase [Candidatus Eremiobacteraeota bacterium]MBV9232692.1 alpha/beta fold hydrolase [Candidatus Eremiobacteraeota bacterium]